MNVIIVGGGKVGRAITEQLSMEGNDLVLIDSNPQTLDEISNLMDVMTLCGNGASHTILTEAGVQKADLVIASTSSDETNMLCCLIASKLGAKHTIARVRNPEYNDHLMFMRNELGLSMAINPEYAAASEAFRMLRFPSAIKIETFSRGRVELVEVKLRDCSGLDGVKLCDLKDKYDARVLICAVQRGQEVIIPNGSFVLKTGDKINIAAAPEQIELFFRYMGILRQEARSVMIIGGGRITYYLAKMLLNLNVQVKIVEHNEQRCKELCELLPKSLIIHGDGTNQDLLLEEGIDSTDAFVTLTGFDEENIILSMYASARKVGKVITKVNRDSLIDLIEMAGLDSIISPKNITANQIVRFVRALRNSLGSNVTTLHKMVGGSIEALEFSAHENSPVIGTPLKELKLQPNILIACISRGTDIIIPGGGDQILPNDNVIVITGSERLSDLSDILQ